MSVTKVRVVKFPKTKNGSTREYNNPIYRSVAARPIKDAEVMKKLRSSILKDGKYGRRNLAIWDLGIYSGRRCGDILNLRISEVWDDITGDIKEKITYVDHKTSKRKADGTIKPRWLSFMLCDKAKALLKEYLELYGLIKDGKRIVPIETLLFTSRKGGPIWVRSYTAIIKKAAADAGIRTEHLSSHTMRKTFAVSVFKAGGGEFVRQALGHTSMAATDHYIGNDDEFEKEWFSSVNIPGLD